MLWTLYVSTFRICLNVLEFINFVCVIRIDPRIRVDICISIGFGVIVKFGFDIYACIIIGLWVSLGSIRIGVHASMGRVFA